MITRTLPRNGSKALVRVDTRAGRPVVVKDFGSRPWWLRLIYGRPALRRELRAYARLEGLSGIAECLGLEGPDALILQRLPGESLDDSLIGKLPESVFDRLAGLVRAIHARGVAITDLHKSNVLVNEDGSVHLVDFAMARVTRPGRRPGPLLRALMRLDRHAVARIRARYLSQEEPSLSGWLGWCYQRGRQTKRIIHFLATARPSSWRAFTEQL